jgi:glycosyltransferase involved in cell wall biosynthesis
VNKAVNIWILNHYAVPPDSPGGTRHYDFARELVKRGHKVTIFASSFGHRSRKEERLRGRQNHLIREINGIRFIWVRTFPYQKNDWRRAANMLSYGCRVIFRGLRLKERPDVILGSSPHPFAGLAGYILSRRKKAKFIFEVRDLWPQTLVEVGSYPKKSLTVKLLGALEKFLYRKAQKIVVLMPWAAEYIKGLGIPGDKIAYIPNGASPELFTGTSARIPEKLDKLISVLKSEGKVMVGYTGAHGLADGLDTILETAKLFQDKDVEQIHFLLVGDGAEKKRLMSKAKSLGLNNLIFFELVPKNAMAELLRAIDIALVPLRKSEMWKYGTSKNKLFDNMICAKPIIWAINSGDDPVAEANCGLTVPPEDPEAMAEAITRLCSISAGERREMGMRGHEYIMKYQAIPVLADRLMEILEKVKEP